MPDLDLSSWSLDQLNAERNKLIGNSSSADDLSDDDLQRLVAVSHAMRLRTRTAGKPKASSRSKKEKPTIDSIDFT